MAQKSTYRIAIVGRAGYGGQVLHALLMHHPCMVPESAGARNPADLSPVQRDRLQNCDAVALAVPEGPAQAWAAALAELEGVRVLDLSGAHRLEPEIHYGLPELFGRPSRSSRIVANPGCYPTAALLALRPLLDVGVISGHGIAVLGQSGASGAGKGLRDDLQFCELAQNVFPYNVGEHRHAPEIERHLGAPVSFVTVLLPVVRGLLVTAFVPAQANPATLVDALRARYDSAPFVTVLPTPGSGLGLRHVVGTHQAVLAVGPRQSSGLVPVFASIDNLMRGAASQALHNLNLWLGLDPELGLPPPMLATPEGVPGMARMLP